jgi:TfoX/Sxy family transcriptional regulator of competence genes
VPIQAGSSVTQLQRLAEILEAAAARLPDVTTKRLFGCQALYRTGAVFALVWKTGRIGVKLPLAARHQELMLLDGAEPWIAHAVMAQWVLVPERFHDDSRLLTKWLRIAYELAGKEASTKPRAKAGAKSKKAGSVTAKTSVNSRAKKKHVTSEKKI